MGWNSRLWNLIRRRTLDHELEEELRFHLDSRTRDNLSAGMSPDDARRDAVRRFGNPTLTQELTRETDLLSSVEFLLRDIRYAVRGLRKTPGFSAVAILVLALGVGANTAVFTVVNSVLLRPLPFPQSGRLFTISYGPRESSNHFGPSMADRHYLEFRAQQQQFESVATMDGNPVTLTRAGDPVRLNGAAVTSDFLKVLRVQPVIGRGFTAGDSEAVLLGDKVWRTRFRGDPAIVGKTLTLDGVFHTVIGVMPPGFDYPSGADLWLPLEVRVQPNNTLARPVIGRLRDGVTRERAQDVLAAFTASLPLDSGEKRTDFEARVRPLKDMIVRNSRESLFLFAGAVAFVLLIACANIAGLLLTRTASRSRELTVRAALGASRGNLVRQLLIESLVVALTGGAAGIFLALEGVPALVALAPTGTLPRAIEIGFDFRVLAFALLVSILAGVAFGLIPALRATRCDLRETLSAGGRTLTAGRERLRGILAVSEIAFALILLTGAGLLLKSFLRMQAVDPGFRPRNVLTATVDLPDSRYHAAPQMRTFHEKILGKLSSLPGVEAAGAVNWIPLGPALIQGDFQMEGGRRPPQGFTVDKPVVTAGYFRAMGIRMLRGRDFSERDNAGAPGVVIISRSVARLLWAGEDPVGKRISMQDHPEPGDWLTIVGVVDDVRQSELTTQPSPAVYKPYLQVNQPFFLGHMTYVVRTADRPSALAPAVRAAIQSVDPELAVQSLATMGEVIAGKTAGPRFLTLMMGGFSILAMLLSAMGIYGLLAFAVASRTREIGIRMAMGAARKRVLLMILRRTLWLAAAGLVLGSAGAVALTRLLRNFLFDVTPTDPATFGMVAACLVAVALLAGLIPAYRAAAVDPLEALRYE